MERRRSKQKYPNYLDQFEQVLERNFGIMEKLDFTIADNDTLDWKPFLKANYSTVDSKFYAELLTALQRGEIDRYNAHTIYKYCSEFIEFFGVEVALDLAELQKAINEFLELYEAPIISFSKSKMALKKIIIAKRQQRYQGMDIHRYKMYLRAKLARMSDIERK